MKILFSWEVILREAVQQDPMLHMLTEMAPNDKKEFQSF